MHRRSRLLIAAVTATLGLSTTVVRAADPSSTAEPTTAELLEQIKQLQSKVEQMEAKQKQQSADVAQTVQQIVADAEKRSTLMLQTTGQNILAGHENGKFILRSEDGNYVLSPSLELQIRNTTNYNASDDGGTWENGFEIRRAKFRFEGNAITPNLTYALQWETSQSTGGVTLEDAWVRYKFEPDWFVRGGQFKDPLVHEELVSGRRQLTADRSLMANLLTLDSDNYIQGVSLIYDRADGPIRAEVAFTDGILDDNSNYQDNPPNDNDFGFAGRVEYFARGASAIGRKEYDDFTALNNKEDLLVFGAAADVTQGGDQNVFIQTVDVQWENTTGWGAYAAFIGRLTTGDTDTYNWGALVQGSYLFKPKWEAFGRFDFTLYDDEQVIPGIGEGDFFPEFTLGVNYYVQGQSAKFTLDATYLPDGSPTNQNGIGVQAGDEEQFVFRAQFQLLI